MKYILMQKENGQIKIVDVSTDIGRQCATDGQTTKTDVIAWQKCPKPHKGGSKK
jgi:hypothetical protein